MKMKKIIASIAVVIGIAVIAVIAIFVNHMNRAESPEEKENSTVATTAVATEIKIFADDISQYYQDKKENLSEYEISIMKELGFICSDEGISYYGEKIYYPAIYFMEDVSLYTVLFTTDIGELDQATVYGSIPIADVHMIGADISYRTISANQDSATVLNETTNQTEVWSFGKKVS